MHRGQDVTVLLVNGARVSGRLVDSAEQAFINGDLPEMALAEVTVEVAEGGARPWHYRIPATAIVFLTYPAPKEDDPDA